MENETIEVRDWFRPACPESSGVFSRHPAGQCSGRGSHFLRSQQDYVGQDAF